MIDGYEISNDQTRIQIDRVYALLRESYWAADRSEEDTRVAVRNSYCFGVYTADGLQIGFARVFSDWVTAYYLMDVIIDEAYRGKGLGKALIEAIVNDSRLSKLGGILATKDAHGLYQKYGFTERPGIYMSRRPTQLQRCVTHTALG